MTRALGLLIVVAGGLALVGGSHAATAQVRWMLDLDGGERFFDLPFPSELQRRTDGTLRIGELAFPLGPRLMARTLEAIERGYGYSTATAVYFRFDGAVDAQQLPAPGESADLDSPIFLIDVDPDSPERGERFYLSSGFYPRPLRDLPTSPTNLLAMMPLPGFPLRPDTLYAAGVKRTLGDRRGQPLAASADLATIARGETPAGDLGAAAAGVYGPALSTLAEMGVPTDEIAALTVFRTGDPLQRSLALFDALEGIPPLEWEQPPQPGHQYDGFVVLDGTVRMPQFQDGTPPYSKGKGGRLQFDEQGRLVAQRTETVPVCLAIPRGEMPAGGFPVLIYIHGTGGVSTQVVDRGVITGTERELIWPPPGTGPAMVLAHRGIASVGAAQPQNAQRGGAPSMAPFYNLWSPEALRDNILQASAEATLLLRSLQQLEIDPALCDGVETAGQPVRFDPDLVFGMGQSLGSTILSTWAAMEPDLKAVIPTGAGAYYVLFAAESNPANRRRLRGKDVGMGERMGIHRHHPLLTLTCTVLAPVDMMVHMPRLAVDPLPGRSPKHVLLPAGIHDHYFHPVSQNATMAVAGLDLAGPALHPDTVPLLELAGLDQLDYPVSLNRETPGGAVTAVAVQALQQPPLDGHHVAFQRDDLRYQYGCFLQSLVRDGVPTLYEPGAGWDGGCGP